MILQLDLLILQFDALGLLPEFGDAIFVFAGGAALGIRTKSVLNSCKTAEIL
jgi:hypothetical protein